VVLLERNWLSQLANGEPPLDDVAAYLLRFGEHF
jgi:hypothetical protein